MSSELIIQRKSTSLVAGAYSFSTQTFYGHVLQWLYVKPTTGTNTYDVTLTNSNGDVVMSRTSVTGTINELDIGTPLIGTYTLAIANGTVTTDPVVVNISGRR